MSNDMPMGNLSRFHLSQLLSTAPKALRPHLHIHQHHLVFHNHPQRSHKAYNMYQPYKAISPGALHCSHRAQDRLR